MRTSPAWDEHTIPAGLRRRHRLGAHTWGVIVVSEGALRLIMTPSISVDLTRGSHGPAIPPDVEHHVEAQGHVVFSIDFYTVD
ncbi:MAG: DUF1971 domain-containing protein [Acidimicrobiales bacterium]